MNARRVLLAIKMLSSPNKGEATRRAIFPFAACLLCHCCTQLRLVCNALSIDKVSTRYRYLANSYDYDDDDDAVQTQHNVQYLDYLFAAAEVSFRLSMYVCVCVCLFGCVCVLVCCGHVCGLVSLSASLHSLFSGFVLAEQSNLTAECKLRITKLRSALQDALLIPHLLLLLPSPPGWQ